MRTSALLSLILLFLVLVASAVYAAVAVPGGHSEAAGTDTIVRYFDVPPGRWDTPKNFFVFAPSADVQLVFLPEKASALNDTIPVLANYPWPMTNLPRGVIGFKIIRPVSTAVRYAVW